MSINTIFLLLPALARAGVHPPWGRNEKGVCWGVAGPQGLPPGASFLSDSECPSSDPLLPRTLIHGDKKGGFSIFWADDGLDTGDLLLQKECEVLPDDTVSSLYNRFLFPEGVKGMVRAGRRCHTCPLRLPQPAPPPGPACRPGTGWESAPRIPGFRRERALISGFQEAGLEHIMCCIR